MARKLPWLQSPSLKSAQRPPAKRQKLLHQPPDSDSDANTTSNPARKPKCKNSHTENRTPSTSPPPLPPSQHTMRAGLHADDGYIMVEDEFLATAQLYTKHLHHAEYQRLKNLARTRQTQVPDTDITRPVSTTVMRDELRQRKAAEARSRKLDAGLDPLLSNGGRKIRVNDFKTQSDEGSESDFELAKDDDPWQGTQLQRFMTVSPRKERGLMGLQGVVSHTRAAAGFAAPERSSGAGAPTSRIVKGKLAASERKTLAEAGDSETEDDEDDDLDIPTTRGSRNSRTIIKRQEPPSPTPQNKSHSPLGNSILNPSLTTTTNIPSPSLKTRKLNPTPTKSKPTPKKRPFLDLHPLPTVKHQLSPSPTPPNMKEEEEVEDEEDPLDSPPQTPEPKPPKQTTSTLLQQRLKAQRERSEREQRARATGGGSAGGRGGAVMEIPVFLV